MLCASISSTSTGLSKSLIDIQVPLLSDLLSLASALEINLFSGSTKITPLRSLSLKWVLLRLEYHLLLFQRRMKLMLYTKHFVTLEPEV